MCKGNIYIYILTRVFFWCRKDWKNWFHWKAKIDTWHHLWETVAVPKMWALFVFLIFIDVVVVVVCFCVYGTGTVVGVEYECIPAYHVYTCVCGFCFVLHCWCCFAFLQFMSYLFSCEKKRKKIKTSEKTLLPCFRQIWLFFIVCIHTCGYILCYILHYITFTTGSSFCWMLCIVKHIEPNRSLGNSAVEMWYYY